MAQQQVKVRLPMTGKDDDIRRIMVGDMASLRQAVLSQYAIDPLIHEPRFKWLDGLLPTSPLRVCLPP